ncbi:phage head closure protein [Ruminococcaceae bacterium OttesenSCG-928-I18]|nr:phage head closure protein [Ruminococcaceae bacterium OttesenSCG-928-I18]
MARRKPIQVQACNEDGEWGHFANCRADITGTGGSEYNAAGAEQASFQKRFRVKYHKSLANLIPQATRIVFDEKMYDVVAIDDFEERHIELVFRTEARHGR